MLFRPRESSLDLKIKSLVPTTVSPRMMKEIPSHLMDSSTRCKKATERRPVKIMTAPLSIWKEDAYVSVSPTYIVLVAVTIK